MTKTFNLKKTLEGGFYTEASNPWRFAVCTGAVLSTGIKANRVRMDIRTTRPGKKGWRKVEYVEGNFRLGRRLYGHLPEHLDLLVESGQYVGWIKFTPI